MDYNLFQLVRGDKMVIFSDGTWQTHSDFPDTDFSGGEAAYVVPDDSPLAAKIMSMPQIVPITDSSGNIIDADPAPADPTEAIKAQLSEIDRAAVRPIRAVLAGTATDEDRARLEELERQAEALRVKLK